MSKICGYSCEHNKSGVCQISVCDKKSYMSDKTEVQTFTRYIDPTITELQQENQSLKDRIEKAIEKIENHYSISTESDLHLINKIDQRYLLEILKGDK